MVAVVVSVVGAVSILVFGLEAHGRNQGRTQQKRTYIPMQSHVFLLRRDSIVLDPLVPLVRQQPWARLYNFEHFSLNVLGISFSSRRWAGIQHVFCDEWN